MTVQTCILLALYALLLVGFLFTLMAWLQARAFLTTYPAINSESEFDEFKRIVKVNMYIALAIIAIFGLAIVLAAAGLYLGVFSWTQLWLGLIIFGPLCMVGGIMMTVCENKLKTQIAVDASLREEFDRVVHRWTSSALPDW